MPREATVGRLLLENALPESVHGELGVLDKKGIAKLGAALAALGPDAYRTAMKKLTEVSTRAGYESGGYSFGPEDMVPGPQTQAVRNDLKQKVAQILARTDLDPKTRDNEVARVSLEAMQPLQDAALGEARASGNPLAKQVDSGAKGSGVNLRALIAGDVVYTDQNYKPIPYPVVHSFAEGLRPHEFAASTFGARQAISSTKLGTAKGGYLSKRMGNMAHRLVVTAHDGPPPEPGSAPLGYPVDVADPDNENTFLAHPAGGYERNTHLTRDVLANLRKQGVGKILIRSPMVGGPGDGGVYGYDVGIRERNRIAPVGDFVGRAAADSVAEPVVQTIIGCIVGGTKVRMADWSTKAIEDVRVGDYVIGVDMDGRTRPTRVVRTFDNGVRECVRAAFTVGRGKELVTFDATPDHKILATTLEPSGPDRLLRDQPRQLPIGHSVGKGGRMFALPAGQFDTPASFTHEPRALLLGLLIGDGCYTAGVGFRPQLSCADPLLLSDIAPYLASLNLKLSPTKAGNGLTYLFTQIEQEKTRRDNATGRMTSGRRNPATKMLDEFGHLGKYAHEKTIPECAFQWSNASVASLLAGLFVTDGSVCRQAGSSNLMVTYASTSRRLVEQIADLLAWRFGIHVGAVKKTTVGRRRLLYSIGLYRYADIQKFRHLLPWVGVKRRTYDTLLDATGLEKQQRASTISRGKIAAGLRYRRQSVASIGLQPTYDIEVENESHLFLLSNGIVCSNSKHSGGVAGTTSVQQGFDTIERMFSVPSVYQGGVTHAQRDGMVGDVRPAPQGGHYVLVDGEEHYVHPDLKPTVTTGTKVEAGDPLSDGVLNPSELVRHKGIGEARRQFVNEFMRVGKLNGVNANRRNVELVARGFIDHVHVDKEFGEYAPGEVAPYTALAAEYEPREGHQRVDPKSARGMYLERPALHYSIGTRVTPSVVQTLNDHGVTHVTAHKEPPPFSPVLIRSNDTLSYDRDWTTQMLGSGLSKSLLKSVGRGAVSDPKGTSFVPALAEGINFGNPDTKTRGWAVSPPPKPPIG